VYVCMYVCMLRFNLVISIVCEQDFMHAVAADPKVLSILSKNRSEKGYRFHQGPRLRLLLASLKQTMGSTWIVTNQLFKIVHLPEFLTCLFTGVFFILINSIYLR